MRDNLDFTPVKSLHQTDNSNLINFLQQDPHGYSSKGQKCYGLQDWGAKGRTNVIGALCKGVLLTVTLLNGSVNTEVFNAWVEQDLIPKLPPKSVVIMDNATFNKSPLIYEMLENGVSGRKMLKTRLAYCTNNSFLLP